MEMGLDGVYPKQEMRGSWPWEKAPQLGWDVEKWENRSSMETWVKDVEGIKTVMKFKNNLLYDDYLQNTAYKI